MAQGRKILLCRYGGIGDAVILTVVAKELKLREPDCLIHFTVPEHQVPLFDNLSIFDKVLPTRRMGSQQLDCVSTEFGWITIEALKVEYDFVVDYKYSIELNGQYRDLANRQGTFMLTQNSNYQNWIDLSLGWANIDPTTVLDKRPVYKIKPEETEWAKKAISKPSGSKLIGIQLTASSLTRTWYQQDQLPQAIFEFDPTATILAYTNDENWVMLTKYGPKRIPLDSKNALRQSAALISQMDVFISADSGMAHIAQAIGGIKQIILYTTVPGWTRAKYFTDTKIVETSGKLACSPCFMIHRYCPVNMKRAEESLDEREKQVLALSRQNLPLPLAARHLATTPEGLNQEMGAIQNKLHALSNRVPDCILSITPDMIMEKLKEFYTEWQLTQAYRDIPQIPVT